MDQPGGGHAYRDVLDELAICRKEAHASSAGPGGPTWLLPSCFQLFEEHIKPSAARVRNRSGLLHFSLDRAWKLKKKFPESLLLEFGVYRGGDISYLAAAVSRKPGGDRAVFHGFDSFEGLPESWSIPGLTGGVAYERGAFDLKGETPDVGAANVVLHRGWFEDTVAPFLDERCEIYKK